MTIHEPTFTQSFDDEKSMQDRIDALKAEPFVLTPEQYGALSKLDDSAEKLYEAAGVVDIAGVIAGVKPAALLTEREVSSALVQATGLHVIAMDDTKYAISRDEEIARTLAKEAVIRDENGNISPETHRKIGKFLGYPDTSIDYFIRRSATLFTDGELPKVVPNSTKNKVEALFHAIILSPDNYEDEIVQFAIPLQAAARELTPNSYAIFEKNATNEEPEGADKIKILSVE